MSLSDRIRPNCEAAAWVCEEVKELERENAALRKDKERMDWLIKNQIGVAYGAVSFEAFDKITRVAIDAARKAQP